MNGAEDMALTHGALPLEAADEVKRLRDLKFPTELRKMWSGSEVQEWLNQNLAK